MDDFPKITTQRLLLRGSEIKDLQPVYEICSDPVVMRYYGVELYDSLEKAQKNLDWLASLYRESKGLRWVITLKDEDNCARAISNGCNLICRVLVLYYL
jgi:ribosomal-protein-alanine N-acetyltransferase